MSVPDINNGNLSGLMFASMKNDMTTPDQYNYWRKQTIFGNRGSLSSQQIQSELDTILSNTTIKRACCLASPVDGDPDHYKVNVRVPVPKTWTDNGGDKRNLDYGFIDKAIKIPKTYCNAVQSSDGSVSPYIKPNKRDANYSKQCDDFYSVYCPNMMTYFVNESKALNPDSDIDTREFANFYKQECACFDLFDIFPPSTNLSARCLKFPQCNDSNGDQGVVYLDQESRKQCPDNITICSQVQNLSGAGAGRDINVKTFMENTCGASGGKTSEVVDDDTTAGGSTNIDSTTSQNDLAPSGSTTSSSSNTGSSADGSSTNTTDTNNGTSDSTTDDLTGNNELIDNSVFSQASTPPPLAQNTSSSSTTYFGFLPAWALILLIFTLLLLSIASSVGVYFMTK